MSEDTLQLVMEADGWDAEDPSTAGPESWSRGNEIGDADISTPDDCCMAAIRYLQVQLRKQDRKVKHRGSIGVKWARVLFCKGDPEQTLDRLLELVEYERKTRL